MRRLPGGESDYRCLEIGSQIKAWTKRARTGNAFGSGTEFLLPDGAALSPDSAWVSNERLSELSGLERKQFLRLVPEFVVEVLSPGNRLSAAKKKMQCWIANGMELGWLIDGDAKTVHVYRRGMEPRQITDATMLPGEGPLDGFVLDLTEIREGL